MQWEYLKEFVGHPANSYNDIDAFNRRGLEGWELAFLDADSGMAVFKRPKVVLLDEPIEATKRLL